MSTTTVTTLPPTVKMEIIKGASKTLEVTVVDKDGVAVDITSATIYFTVKESTDATETKIAKTTAVPSQISITDPTNGKFRVYLVPSDTSTLEVMTYVCDIWVVPTSGKHYPIISPSEFEVKPRVTDVP